MPLTNFLINERTLIEYYGTDKTVMPPYGIINEKHRFPVVVVRSKHIVLSVIIFAIIFSVMAAPCFAADNSISWTEDELAFMDKHPVIRLGIDPEFVPFEFIDDDGEHKGIAADYLSLISEKTGLHFEVVKGLSWPEAYDMALAGDIDALPANRDDTRKSK